MSNRHVIALGALAIALFAFIALFERESLSTGELAGRETRILPRFARDRVTGVTLENPATGSRIELRRAAAGADGEEPRWRLVAPLEAAADEEAVASLLGMLEYADARRRIEATTEEDRTRFGLASPRIVLRLEVGPEESELRIGGEDPTGAGVYAQLGGADGAMVVGLDVFEALDHDADHFRSRALFPEGLGALREVRISHQGAIRRLERAEGRWWLREPVSMWASEARMRDLQRALGELTATRFVPEGVLDSDALYLEVRAEPQAEEGDDTAEGARAPFVLRVGDSCPDHEGERVAQLDEGPLVCVSESDLVPLRVSAENLRELRAVTVQEMDARSITVERRGERLELRDGDDGWTATRIAGGRSEQSAVDLDALSEWMGQLRALRAEGVRPADAAAVRAAGLGSPTITLRIERREDDAPEEILALGAPHGGKVLARRGDEPVLLELPGEALEVTSVGPAHFRSRLLLEATADRVASVEIDRGGRVERLERADVGFRVVAPVEAPADRTATRDLVNRLARLEAREWIGERPDSRQGLASPALEVRFTLDASDGEDAERTHTLKVGAATEGGAYAQLDDDPAVFVLPAPLLELVQGSLASRELLATDALHLEGVVIEAGDRRVELTHDGADFRTTSGPADAQATRELTARLASLRATRVLAAAASDPAFGLGAPRARVEVQRDAASDPPRYTILLGSSDGDGGVYARRDDLPLVFVLPSAAVEAILAYRP